MNEFSEKVILITGGASGIGRATAINLAREGASLSLLDRDESGLQQTVEIIGSAARILTVTVDVTCAEEVRAAVEQTFNMFGRLDGAVNNAGCRPDFAPLPDYPEESFDRDLAVNLKSVFLCMKYEIPKILSGGRGGAIVNVSSIAGVVGTSFSCGYNAAKAGILGLTRAAAVEVAREGISINALCPGFTLTPLTQSAMSTSADLGYTEEKIGSAAPAGRMATADEQAAAIAFMLSPKARFMVGHTMVVDGGLTIQ